MSVPTIFASGRAARRGLLLVLLVLTGVVAGCAGRALAAEPQTTTLVPVAETTPEPRIASVVGTGRVTLSPDMATVRVGVRTENRDVGQAVDENIRLAQAVYAAVQALGVDEKDLQTANFNVYQTTVGPSDNPRKVFVVENTVHITVRNLDDLGAIIAAALDAGANQVYDLRFGASDYAQALDQARQQALDNARDQAQLMADTLGMRLGPPRRVSFGGGQPIPREEMAYKAVPMEAVAEVPIESGELVVTVQAYVDFDLLEP